MKKRILSGALALLLLAGGLCGCEKKDPQKTRPQGSGVKDYGTLGEKDWGGRICSILGVYSDYEESFEIFSESNDGDNVSTAVFNRNNEIAELFNAKVVQVGDAGSAKRFADDIQTDSASYDIAFMFRDDMAKAISANLFVDLLGLQNIDFTQKYYNASTIDSMKIGSKLYHMVSDFSLVDKERITCLYLNRDFAEDSGINSIIEDVETGAWYFSDFATYVKQVSRNVDNEGKMSYKDDIFGVTIGSKDESINFWSGMGAKTVSKDQKGDYFFDYGSDTAIKAADTIKQIFTNSDYYYASEMADNYEGAGDAFEEERALFYGAVLSSLPSISQNTEFSFTVLPFPKLDETQTRYYSNNNNSYCATFGVPICAKDPEFSAFMIEALSWKSTDTTRRIFIDTNCKTRHSYDQVCSDMMELLFNSLSFDFGFMYDADLKTGDNTPKSIVSGCLRYTDRSLASFYAENIGQQKRRLTKDRKSVV